jgi:hypothetical protein
VARTWRPCQSSTAHRLLDAPLYLSLELSPTRTKHKHQAPSTSTYPPYKHPSHASNIQSPAKPATRPLPLPLPLPRATSENFPTSQPGRRYSSCTCNCSLVLPATLERLTPLLAPRSSLLPTYPSPHLNLSYLLPYHYHASPLYRTLVLLPSPHFAVPQFTIAVRPSATASRANPPTILPSPLLVTRPPV